PVYILATPPEGEWTKTRATTPHASRGRTRQIARRITPRLSRSGSRAARPPTIERRPGAGPTANGSSFAEGMRVRVTAGPFADKTGVVTGVDSRGVRVLLGLLATRF